MNIRWSRLVRRACLCAGAIWAAGAFAQGERGSLTKDFNKLSAKERSRIAARETEDAAKDTAYQGLMLRADQFFQAKEYDAALKLFQQAREQRPYNVYPKVKIQDLQALIDKRDREQAAKEAPAPPQAEAVPPAPMPEPEPVSAPELQPAKQPEPVKAREAQQVRQPEPVKALEPQQVQRPAPVKAPESQPVKQAVQAAPAPVRTPVAAVEAQPSAPAPPPSLGERVYKEAGAVVTERTVEDEGKPTVYKKVAHPWGQTFYFKDGLAISNVQWEARFSR